MPTIAFDLDDEQAYALAQLVKRIESRGLGREGLNVVAPWEEEAGQALDGLRKALAEAGFAPR